MGLSLSSEEVQQNLALLPAAANVSAGTHLFFSRYRFWFQEQRSPDPELLLSTSTRRLTTLELSRKTPT